MRDRLERAANKVRAEACRLAFERQCSNSAEIEQRLVDAGMQGVAEALEPIRSTLDQICRSPKNPHIGILGMFKDA
jgi:hypothetical protein